MRLYAFGSNGSGQLGIGHMEDVSIPTRCIFHGPEPPFSSRTAAAAAAAASSLQRGGGIQIAAGGNHTLLLCSDGTVYSAGFDEDGRCGGLNAGKHDGMRTSFSRVVIRDHRRDAGEDCDGELFYGTFRHGAATWEATVLVAESLERDDMDVVFVLGSGGKGELGLGEGCVTTAGTAVRMRDFPPAGTRVVSLAGGMGHVVAVLSNGEVYGWGGARKGQLGEGARRGGKVAWRPVNVEGASFYVTGAACGREFTVLVGDRSKGEFAVLGAADDKWGIRSGSGSAGLVEDGLMQGFRGIEASWHGVYVHRGEGEVMAWGRNDRGQIPPLGEGELGEVRELAVGSEHALALVGPGAGSRRVVAFGWGEHGNCGPATDAQGNVKGKCAEIPLPDGEGLDVVGVGAGCATSWIVMA